MVNKCVGMRLANYFCSGCCGFLFWVLFGTVDSLALGGASAAGRLNAQPLFILGANRTMSGPITY